MAVLFLGVLAGNLLAITTTQIKQAVSYWSGVPVQQITAETDLNGLGGKVWPPDSPALVSSLQQLSGQTIPPTMSNPWIEVADIFEDLGADDDDEEE